MKSDTKFSKYIAGNRYLVKCNSNKFLYEVKFLTITDGAFLIEWCRPDGSFHKEWVEQKEFVKEHSFFEELPHQLPDPKYDSNDPEMKRIEDGMRYYFLNSSVCPICGGSGGVISCDSSTGLKQCPKCWGGKRIWNI